MEGGEDHRQQGVMGKRGRSGEEIVDTEDGLSRD